MCSHLMLDAHVEEECVTQQCQKILLSMRKSRINQSFTCSEVPLKRRVGPMRPPLTSHGPTSASMEVSYDESRRLTIVSTEVWSCRLLLLVLGLCWLRPICAHSAYVSSIQEYTNNTILPTCRYGLRLIALPWDAIARASGTSTARNKPERHSSIPIHVKSHPLY